MKQRTITALILLATALICLPAAAEDGWIQMFDGKTFDNWKIGENADSWKIEDGALVANGPCGHLFYTGEGVPFKNFDFRAQVMTRPNSNSGIYIHTKYQQGGWPKYGYEAQVNNSQGDPQKTASVYAVQSIFKAPAEDDKWFEYRIVVDGKTVTIYIDGEKINEYVEPEGKQPGEDFTRVLDEGTFALQAHDPGSKVYFKDLRVKPLP